MTADKQTILVLFGGRSAEHEISILSAQFIVASLDRERFEPLLVGIDREGRWRRQDVNYLASLTPSAQNIKLDEEGALVMMAPMPTSSSRAGLLLTIEGDRVVQREPFDAAFPVLHGPMGEDGTVQGLFELASVPYVGCGVAASAATMDKVLLKQVLAQSGIPVVLQQVLSRSDYERDAGSCIDRCKVLGFPVYVKPANMGSSLGISKVDSRDALPRAIDKALKYDDKIVIEQGLSNSREIEVSVLGNEDPIASVPGEICVEHADGFYSYAAKYIDADGARLEVPANLSEQQMQAVKEVAIDAFVALGCSGMGRVDLFLTAGGDIFINEINAIPGFTAISMYPQLIAASGITAGELVTQLIDLALSRHLRRAALKTRR